MIIHDFVCSYELPNLGYFYQEQPRTSGKSSDLYRQIKTDKTWYLT